MFFATTCSPAIKYGSHAGLSLEETAKSFAASHLLHNYEKSTVGIQASWAYLSDDFQKELGSIENFVLLMHTRDYLPMLQSKRTQILLTHQYNKDWADLSILIHTKQGTSQYILELRRNHEKAWQIHAITPVSKNKETLIST